MKKQYLIRIAIVAALLTQINHAAFVFDSMSINHDNLLDYILPYVFALSLELSIYLFTLYGKKKVATAFALISFMVNILYYWKLPAMNFQFIAMLAISAIIPLTIWFYSDLLDADIKKEQARKTRQGRVKKKQPARIKLVKEIQESSFAN